MVVWPPPGSSEVFVLTTADDPDTSETDVTVVVPPEGFHVSVLLDAFFSPVGSEVVVTGILDSLEAETAPGRDVLEVEEVEVDSGIVDSGIVEEGKDEEVSSLVDVLEAEDVSSTVEVVDEVSSEVSLVVVAGGREEDEVDVMGSSEVDSVVVVSGTSVVLVGTSVVVLDTGGVGSVVPSEEPVGVSA